MNCIKSFVFCELYIKLKGNGSDRSSQRCGEPKDDRELKNSRTACIAKIPLLEAQNIAKTIKFFFCEVLLDQGQMTRIILAMFLLLPSITSVRTQERKRCGSKTYKL